jgi:mannose/cellobiose epimerase-like protein (N-acyl-D-glucosamine 2-epimerase family)
VSRVRALEERDARRRLSVRLVDVRSWLYEQALPLWGDIGVDPDYGFVEMLALDGSVPDIGYKRMFVQARQVYVFSHAYLSGYARGLDIARGGWDFICEHGWRANGGWARRLDRHGKILDPTLDLYAQGTALFAIAWWIKASEDSSAVRFADGTLDAVDEHLALGSGIGWLSERGPAAALLQNPHMHFLEGLLALYDVTKADRFKAKAAAILELFEAAFFDAGTGTLAEYYDRPWSRAPGERGRIVEPGHHYEWVWLLHQAASSIPISDVPAGALFDFAERFARGRQSGLIVDELFDDGLTRTSSYRLWPTAEALKAHLARFEAHGTLDVGRVCETLDGLFSHFLAAPRAGTWIDRFSSGLDPISDAVPASSFYHVFLALSELLRLEPKLRLAGALA